MSWPARHVPPRMSGSSFRRDWSYSVLLLVAYIAVFSLWMHVPRPLVIASGLAVSAVLALLMARAGRRRYFLNPWDLLWHATVILDIAAEAIVIPRHDGHGFYLCALAFVLVVGGYHGWRMSWVRRKAGSLPFTGTGSGTGFASASGMGKPEDWETAFEAVYRRGAKAWAAGRRAAGTMFPAEDLAFLATVGCSAQELFDFIDDELVYGEPDFATTLEVQRLRREFFLTVQKGKASAHRASMRDLPAKSDAVDGIAWLPRLIVKARLKLRGEMPDDLMYGCGGDRPFVRRMNTTLPDFLRLVRDSGDDDRRIIDAVKARAGLR